MKKTFFKNLMSLGIIVVLWGIYSLGYLPFGQALDVLTVVVFVTVMTLTAEDVASKTIKHKELITWQYVVLMAFVMACDFLWVFLGVCSTVTQLAVRASLLVASVAGTFVWAVYVYRVSVMTDEERCILVKTYAYRKVARKLGKMNDEEVEKALSKVLFCHLENDCLEGRLLVSEPFTPEYATLDELVQQDGGADSGTAVSVVNGYIKSLIAKRSEKEKN